MEFACAASGAKAVVVMGHTACGAIKGAIDNVQLGNLTLLLDKIAPAVQSCSHHYAGVKTSKNAEFVDMVIQENVKMTVDNIRRRSPILREMEERGEIKIVGSYYDMDIGEVTFFE